MEELLRLLGMTEDLSALDDEALSALMGDLRAEALRVLEEGPSDEQLAQLDQAGVALEAITAEMGVREVAAAEHQARIDELAARIAGPAAEDEVIEEGVETEPVPEAEAAVVPDEVPEAVEPEATPEPVPEAVAAAAPAPVAAPRAAAPLSRRPAATPRISGVNARRPASMQPANRPVTAPAMAMVAAANLPHIPAGAALDSPQALALAMMSGYEASMGYRGPRAKVPIARIGAGDPVNMFGEDRTLRIDDTGANTAKLDRMNSLPALQASGGICAIPNVNYDLPVIGTEARPFRDTALNRVGAERGGIRTLPVPDFDELDDAITVWSIANDEDPGSDGPATKPCLAMTCLDFDEDLVDAIVLCLTIGNFRARFNPESVANFIGRAAIAQAREAETRLITAVGAGSTQVTTGELFTSMADVLTHLDLLLAGIFSRRRLPNGFPFRLALPRWLLGNLRAGEARRGTSRTTDESYAATDAQLSSWIASRGVNLTWMLDGESGQVFQSQGDGPINGWPSTAVGYLYPEGSWNFLDGGMLDIGIIRDTTNTGVNNYTIFSETWEGTHFHGLAESHRIAFNLCPSGELSSDATVAVCSTGS